MSCGFVRSATGYKKLAKDMPCEDAVKMVRLGHGTICAVADGHGDERCKHAHKGALFAVEAACEVLRAIYNIHPDNNNLYEYIADNRDDIVCKIVKKWNSLVCADYYSQYGENETAHELMAYVNNLFSGISGKMSVDDARIFYAEQERYEIELKRITNLYGTTLNVVFNTNDFIFCAGIGDGDIISVQGKSAEWLLPPSEQFSTKTESLCFRPSKASERFRTVIIRKNKGKHRSKLFDTGIRPDFIIIATDGLRNSFTSDDVFLDKLIEINSQKSKQYKSFRSNSKAWIEQLTKDSLYRDDITFGFIYG